jgi:hypothetical protein
VMLPPLIFNWFDTLDEIAFPICQRTCCSIKLQRDVSGLEPLNRLYGYIWFLWARLLNFCLASVASHSCTPCPLLNWTLKWVTQQAMLFAPIAGSQNI